MARKLEKNAPPITGQGISAASEAKRIGRYLRFKFRGDSPTLDRLEFRFNSDSTWRPSYFQRGDTQYPLHWPDVETAVSLCFLGYVDWFLSRKTEPFLFGAQTVDAVFAKQLSGAIYQTSHKIHDLFYGENPKNKDGNPIVTHLVFPSVPGISKSGKSKSRPLMMAVDGKFLPADCIEVFWDFCGAIPLVQVADIRLLANRIRESVGQTQTGVTRMPVIAPQPTSALSVHDPIARDIRLLSSVTEKAPPDDAVANPTTCAIREALRQFHFDHHAQHLRVGAIRSPAELEDLWNIDNAAYGDASITFEIFREWWTSFPRGLHVLFFCNRIMGAIGVWPLSREWVEMLKNAQVRESALRGESMKSFNDSPARFWYISGIVLRPDLIGSRAIKILLSQGISSWLKGAKIEFPCELSALAYSRQGEALLDGFNFYKIQNAAAMPDKSPLYGLEINSRKEFVRMMNERGLDLT